MLKSVYSDETMSLYSVLWRKGGHFWWSEWSSKDCQKHQHDQTHTKWHLTTKCIMWKLLVNSLQRQTMTRVVTDLGYFNLTPKTKDKAWNGDQRTIPQNRQFALKNRTVPQGVNVKGLMEHLHHVRLNLITSGNWHILHNNAPAQSALIMKSFFGQKKGHNAGKKEKKNHTHTTCQSWLLQISCFLSSKQSSKGGILITFNDMQLVNWPASLLKS